MLISYFRPLWFTLIISPLNSRPKFCDLDLIVKTIYRKIPKISPGAYIFQRPFLRGLSTEGNLRLKIDWASLIVGSKFTVFALFYFVFEGSFPSTSPRGAYIRRGDLTEGFLRYRFGGLIFGGAYTWRGLFSEFYGILLGVSQGTGMGAKNLALLRTAIGYFLLFFFFTVLDEGFSPTPQTSLSLC